MKGNAQHGIQVVNRKMALQLNGEVTVRTEQVDNFKDVVNDCLQVAFPKENTVQEVKSAYEAHKSAYEDLVESCELAKAQVEIFASHYDKIREELKKSTQEVQLFDIEARKLKIFYLNKGFQYINKLVMGPHGVIKSIMIKMAF